ASIIAAREDHPFYSREDLQKRTSLNQTQIQNLTRMGVLDELNEEDQLSLF
ncbi:MAG: hypothetical protein IKE77_01530, partial [Erysipelotrichaceae bacterium]|nr:hypothetical protein [Erysipelotrichaceae bacterium]